MSATTKSAEPAKSAETVDTGIDLEAVREAAAQAEQEKLAARERRQAHIERRRTQLAERDRQGRTRSEAFVAARRAGRPTSATGRARLAEIQPFASFIAVPEQIRELSETLRTEQAHRAELVAHRHDLEQQRRSGVDEAERARLGCAIRELQRQSALADNAVLEAAAQLVEAVQAIPASTR